MNFRPHHENARGKGREGFTLSEVLVAMVLLSIVTQAVYQFYSIGLRSYRNTQFNADMVGSARYLKKLIEEKISFKSNNNFNIFMKKNGFSTISGLNNILVELPEGRNVALYTALGFSDYLVHQSKNIEECTSEAILKKLAALGHIYNSEFSGNYITEVTKEAGLLNGSSFSFSFSSAPLSMLGASFCGQGDSVKISAGFNPSLTAEINVSGLSDISYLLSGAPASPLTLGVTANKQSAYNGRVFDLWASFDLKQAPVFTPGTGMTALDAKTYFVTGTNLFCDDGMLFYEQDINDRFVNHAFYVKTPDAAEAELDSDGNALKQLRYAFARLEASGWKRIDDAVISNIESIVFKYFNKDGSEIACDKNYWQWHKGDEIYMINIDLTVKKEDYKQNFKMTIEL